MKIKLRGNTETYWNGSNPLLDDREICIATDAKNFKIGPGNWNSLNYWIQAGDTTDIESTLADHTAELTAIALILQSNDINLDEFQEIVNAINALIEGQFSGSYNDLTDKPDYLLKSSIQKKPTVLVNVNPIVWDCADGAHAQVTLTATRNISAPINAVNGVIYRLDVIQSAGLARTLNWDSAYIFPDGFNKNIKKNPSSVTSFHFKYDGTSFIYIYGGAQIERQYGDVEIDNMYADFGLKVGFEIEGEAIAYTRFSHSKISSHVDANVKSLNLSAGTGSGDIYFGDGSGMVLQSMYPTVPDVSASGVIAIQCKSRVKEINLFENITTLRISAPQLAFNSDYFLLFIQDNTGGRTVSYPVSDSGGGIDVFGDFSIGVGANEVTVIQLIFVGDIALETSRAFVVANTKFPV